VTCECGCGYEGEDEVAQFLIEEACLLLLDLEEAAAERAAGEEHKHENAIAKSVGRAKRLFGGDS
jgi:hypothetical protein